MDPMTIMMMASGALSAAQGGLSIFGQLAGNSSAKRAARLKVGNLQASVPLIGQETAFAQSKIIDQVDQVMGSEVNYYAGGNIDPTSGSPAIVQAMSAAQGETDVMLAGARGAQKRADVFQQIADTYTGQGEKSRSLAFGIGTSLLNTASSWVGLGAFGLKNGMFGTGSAAGGMAAGNTFAAARQFNGFNGFGV